MVCDRGYLRHQKQWRDAVADGARCRVEQVEGTWWFRWKRLRIRRNSRRERSRRDPQGLGTVFEKADAPEAAGFGKCPSRNWESRRLRPRQTAFEAEAR